VVWRLLALAALKDVIIKHPLSIHSLSLSNSVKETILAYSLPVGLEGEQPIETGPPSEQAVLTPLFAMAGSFIGGLRLLLLSIFDTKRYSSAHRAFLLVFIVGVALSAIVTMLEMSFCYLMK